MGFLKGIDDESEQSAQLDVVPYNMTVVPSLEGMAGKLVLSFSSG